MNINFFGLLIGKIFVLLTLILRLLFPDVIDSTPEEWMGDKVVNECSFVVK